MCFCKVIHSLKDIKFYLHIFYHLQVCITYQFGIKAQGYFKGLILFANVFLMLTRLNLKRGGGELVEPRSQIVSKRKNAPQASIVMVHEEGPKGMSEDEITFRKAFFEMYETLKVLYEERNSRLYGESSKPPKGDGGK